MNRALELETTFTGKSIDLHAGYDHSASFKTYWSADEGQVNRSSLGPRIWSPHCSGFRMEYDRGTETSIYLVQSESFYTAPSFWASLFSCDLFSRENRSSNESSSQTNKSCGRSLRSA